MQHVHNWSHLFYFNPLHCSVDRFFCQAAAKGLQSGLKAKPKKKSKKDKKDKKDEEEVAEPGVWVGAKPWYCKLLGVEAGGCYYQNLPMSCEVSA